jgi:hypothetical protein
MWHWWHNQGPTHGVVATLHSSHVALATTLENSFTTGYFRTDNDRALLAVRVFNR